MPAAEHHELWRLSSLLAAGIPVALSTDAPFGDADPWAALRAAVHRRTAAGVELGSGERVDARTALELFFGTGPDPAARRSIAPGQPGDLCILAVSPQRLLSELDGRTVTATVIDGAVVYTRN